MFLPPADPVQWSADQVIHWAVWVMKEFSMVDVDVGTIHILGRELCSFSQEEFLQRVPHGEILWSHLELLRKCECTPGGRQETVAVHMLRARITLSPQTCSPVRTSRARSPR